MLPPAFSSRSASRPARLSRIVSRIVQRLSKVCSPDAGLLLLDHPHDVVHRHVGEADTDFAVHGPFDDPGRGDRRGSRFAVGGDQSRHAEFRAAEVADHRYEAVRDSDREHLPENRLAGRTRRLAVVVGAERLAVRPQPPGVAVVRGVVVAFAQRVEPLADLPFRADGINVGEKLAAPLPRRRFGRSVHGQITVVVHPTAPFLNIRSQRMFAGKRLEASSDSQTNDALPTMWSSGTNPQKRESAELWRLSPIIQ